MGIVYLLADQFEAPPEPFRTGQAGCAWLSEDGALEQNVRVHLSANSTHALLGHGVVDALNDLSLEGRLGDGQATLIPPPTLDSARSIFYAADRKTYGACYEFIVESGETRADTQYRIRIDNREYQAALSELTYLVSTASREGRAVWIRI